MADQNSTQYEAAYVTEPISKLDPKEYNGRVRRIFAEAILAGELTAGDVVTMAKLPANASIIQAELSVSASLGAGTLDCGWAISAGGNEAADPNGIIDGFDSTATTLVALDKSAAGADAAFNKKFSEPVDIQITAMDANTTSGSGDTIRLEILYTID